MTGPVYSSILLGASSIEIDVSKVAEQTKKIAFLAQLVRGQMKAAQDSGKDVLFVPTLECVIRSVKESEETRQAVMNYMIAQGHTPKPRASRDRTSQVNSRPERPERGNFHRPL